MCGRFTKLYSWKELHRLSSLLLHWTPNPEEIELTPSYNVAPTQAVPVIRQRREGTTIEEMRWGLVPSWAQDPSIGSRLINARSEEAAAKPSFRSAVKKRRCLVPVSGFYEWQALPNQKAKQPWYFAVTGTDLFCFAGLYEFWEKEALLSFTILTGPPNELIAPIHNRMPCIVKPEDYAAWLDPAQEDWSKVAPFIQPYAAGLMHADRVSTKVNSPRNNGPELVQPLPA